MHGRCCFACFFPDIPRDVCAVTGGPDLIIQVNYINMYHYLMTICQISSFVVNIFTLIFEVQYTLVFKDVVVMFRKQNFITILKHWCPSNSKRFLMKTFLLSSSRTIVLPDYLLNTAKFKLFMLKRFYFPCHVYFF